MSTSQLDFFVSKQIQQSSHQHQVSFLFLFVQTKSFNLDPIFRAVPIIPQCDSCIKMILIMSKSSCLKRHYFFKEQSQKEKRQKGIGKVLPQKPPQRHRHSFNVGFRVCFEEREVEQNIKKRLKSVID